MSKEKLSTAELVNQKLAYAIRQLEELKMKHIETVEKNEIIRVNEALSDLNTGLEEVMTLVNQEAHRKGAPFFVPALVAHTEEKLGWKSDEKSSTFSSAESISESVRVIDLVLNKLKFHQKNLVTIMEVYFLKMDHGSLRQSQSEEDFMNAVSASYNQMLDSAKRYNGDLSKEDVGSHYRLRSLSPDKAAAFEQNIGMAYMKVVEDFTYAQQVFSYMLDSWPEGFK